MPPPKLYAEARLLRFPAGSLARIQAVLRAREGASELMRVAIMREVERREAEQPDAAPPDDPGSLP